MREKKEININIGNRIKAAREAAGLTQERFAEMTSLATKNVSDIERGVVGISVGSLIRICDVLSVSSDTILFGSSNADPGIGIEARLAQLPPEQYGIAMDIINKLFQAFATTKQDISNVDG